MVRVRRYVVYGNDNYYVGCFILEEKGHLQQVNDSHIHDIGKWIFATSFLWSYLFFSQMMLYWYANIPEG